MKPTTLFLLAITLSIAPASSDSQSSANYSITAGTADLAGQRATSTNYTHDGSAGLIRGKSANMSGSVVAENGYAAQLDPDGNNTPLAVVSVVSRKAHGGSGTFDVSLPLTGMPGIECRTGGAGGNHQVLITFSTPITVNGVSVVSIDGQAGGTQSVNGSEVTVNLSAVANAQTIQITLTGVNNGSTAGDVFVPMSILAGDTNGNGAVSASDIGQTKAGSGQATTGANFRSDVNTSGSINASDIGLVKSRSGTVLP